MQTCGLHCVYSIHSIHSMQEADPKFLGTKVWRRWRRTDRPAGRVVPMAGAGARRGESETVSHQFESGFGLV
jgi:hypothetical protein